MSMYLKIYKIPGEKRNSRELSPEDLALNQELERKVNEWHTRDRTLTNRATRASYVISDTMEPTKHMVDGKMYDSKSKFRQATRDAGCIEVGNEVSTMLKPRKPIEPSRAERRDHIRKAIYDLRNNSVGR